MKTKVAKVKKSKSAKDPGCVSIVCVLDRSGSMESMAGEAIGGFNSFLEDQKNVPGNAIMSVLLFDHEYKYVCTACPIADVRELDRTTYVPRGTTALLDAIGRAITEESNFTTHSKLGKITKRIVCIVTDGMENASTDFTREKVKQLIESKRSEGWEFVFLAANVDAFAIGSSYGISIGTTSSYNANVAGGTRNAYNTTSCFVSQLRTGSVNK